MKDPKILKRKGKYLSLLLRHKPEQGNLVLDLNGYSIIDPVLKALDITQEELDYIVENNNKSRFIYDEAKTKIRATQGHSVPINLNHLKVKKPPHFLYHGTSLDNRESILNSGLLKGMRHHVHLSKDLETASKVGLRYAKKMEKLWVIQIPARLMHFDGYKFLETENGVWLTDHVPPKYLVE